MGKQTLLILLILTPCALAQTVSSPGSRKDQPPPSNEPEEQEPDEGICLIGTPPDHRLTPSRRASPEVITAAIARAVLDNNIQEDGIGFGRAPDGTVHIVYDLGTTFILGYNFVPWSAARTRRQPQDGGSGLQAPLTPKEAAIAESMRQRRLTQQSNEQLIYDTAIGIQTLAMARVGMPPRQPMIRSSVAPPNFALDARALRHRTRQGLPTTPFLRTSEATRRERFQIEERLVSEESRQLWLQLQDKSLAYMDPLEQMSMRHVREVARLARDNHGHRVEILVTQSTAFSEGGFGSSRYITTNFLTHRVQNYDFLGTMLLHTHPGGRLVPSRADYRAMYQSGQHSVVIMDPRTGVWRRISVDPYGDLGTSLLLDDAFRPPH